MQHIRANNNKTRNFQLKETKSHIYYNTKNPHHVAVLRPAIHAGANTARSCINIKFKMERTKLKQHRQRNKKHAIELILLFHTGPEFHELTRIDKYLDSWLNRTQFVMVLTDSHSK